MDNSRTLGEQRGREKLPQVPSTGRVDYSLARKATLRAFHAGRLSRLDICDAHPDLIRAARFCGEKSPAPCPVCDRGPVTLVSYVFSDDFSKQENGRVWESRDVSPLMKLREARLYTVEVCTDCSWNHVRSQLMLSNPRSSRSQRRGRRAST